MAAIPSISGMLMSIRTTSGQEPGRHLQRLGAGRGRPDHLHVLLEAEKLRQVVASLRDVVHDQDADLVAHRPVGLCLMAGLAWWVRIGGSRRGGRAGPPRAARRLWVSSARERRLDDLRRDHGPLVDELAERDAGRRRRPAASLSLGGAEDRVIGSVDLGETEDLGLLGGDRQDHELGLPVGAGGAGPGGAVPRRVSAVGGGSRVPTTCRFWRIALTEVALMPGHRGTGRSPGRSSRPGTCRRPRCR